MGAPVRLALVGCGWIAGEHVAGYADLFERGCSEFQVTACCDPNTDNAAKRAAGIAAVQGQAPVVVPTVEELVAAGLADAADVCVPHCFHHTVAAELLDAGVHVLLEKPVGITIRASRRIIETAERRGCILATAENARRNLAARACTWAIKEKHLIGDVSLVLIQSLDNQPFDYDRPAFKWRGLKVLIGGGMILDSGAHFADMMQLLFGDVAEVNCTTWTHDRRLIRDAPVLGDAPADVEDTWHATIRFESGVRVVWTYSRSLHGEPVSVANYYGSAGTMAALGYPFHPFDTGARTVLADGTEISQEQIETEYRASLSDEEEARLFPYGATGGFAVEIWDFVNAVATGGQPEMDGHAGLRAKALCECCYESAVAGAPVRFEDVLSGRIDAYQRPIDEFWQLCGTH